MATTDIVDKMFSALLSQQDIRDNAATTSLNSGIMLMQQNKYTQAVGAFKQAVAFSPTLTDAYNYMASAYLQLGKKKEAIDAYSLSLRVDSTQTDPRVNLASIYIDDKNPGDAEKQLKRTLQIDPNYTLAHYMLGNLYQQNNRLSEAVTELKKVIRLSPNDANGYYALGQTYNKQGDYQNAVTQLTEATSKKRDFALAIYELGSAYIGLNQKDQAQTQLTALKGINTSQAADLSNQLSDQLSSPKIFSFNQANSSFIPIFGPGTPLYMLDPSFISAPNTAKDFTVQFQFDSSMDVASVSNIANWSISRSSDPKSGAYVPSNNDAIIAPLPKSVMYDPTTFKATLTFSIAQNSSGAGTIDPSHVVFKFNGKDVNGKPIDPTADQYSGIANKPY